MIKRFLGILLILIFSLSMTSASQNYKALNYDSFIQTNTFYITFYLGLLTLVIALIGIFGYKFFKKLIKDKVKKEIRIRVKNYKEDTNKLIKKVEEDYNKLEKKINIIINNIKNGEEIPEEDINYNNEENIYGDD